MAGGQFYNSALTRQSNLLLDALRRLEKRTFERKAVHIMLSNLKPENIKDHHKRLAKDGFEEMVKKGRGEIYNIHNNDILFIYNTGCQDEVNAAIIKLEFLFASDPIVKNNEKEKFVKFYDLSTEFSELMAVAKRLASIPLNKNQSSGEKTASRGGVFVEESQKPKKTKKPLSAAMLAKVEKALSGTDFANMVRRQSVCALVGKSQPHSLFDEVFVAISDLQEIILPDTNLVASPWLFQHMTETLDRRVLANINKHDDGSLTNNFSINLNVATILSSDFLKFDDNINESMRSSIVLEIQLVDIFSDLSSFLLARDFVHDRGYRICVDGVNIETIHYIDRDKLGANFIKVFWNQKMIDMVKDETFVNDIKRIGGNNIILCRVDDELAVDTGQKVGIALFQGRHIQRLILEDPRNKRVGTVRV